MAKRFIDTDLFRKPFMRSLEAPYKALWIYLLCECDHAGIWVVELDVAQMRMGLKLDPDKVLQRMGGAVVPVGDGSKWYLPDFVEFQYGQLNPANRVHASVIERLFKCGIDPNDKVENKPLASPLQGAKDKDKDKDTQGRKEHAKVEPTAIVWPAWAGDQTRAKWGQFKAYRKQVHKFSYKGSASEQSAINLLAKEYTNGQSCVDALDEAMAKGWKWPVKASDRATKPAAPPKPGEIDVRNVKPWLIP
jgi:hypothetical protein